MKLYVARHGQTNYNDVGLCNSDPAVDVHLTETGILEATNLSEKLKKVGLDRIFISELKRTRQTAGIINNHHDAPMTVDARLNDNRSGYEDKHYLEYYASLDKADDKWAVRLNGGESLEDVKDRVQSFLDDLKLKNYESVLIVTSMIIVQAIYGIINGLSNQEAWDFQVDKASCIELKL